MNTDTPCERPSHILNFMRTIDLIKAVFREIFDESAYARFLRRKQKGVSRASYAEFLRECEEAKARRPRCC